VAGVFKRTNWDREGKNTGEWGRADGKLVDGEAHGLRQRTDFTTSISTFLSPLQLKNKRAQHTTQIKWKHTLIC